MKKITLILLIICTICVSMTAYAENSPRLIVESVEAVTGDTITVNINIENNPGFAAMVLELSYDSNVLSPVSVSGGEVLGNIGILSNIQQGGDLKQYNPVSLTVINPTDIKDNGNVFAVIFNVFGELEEDVELNLSYKEADISNQNYEDVNCEIVQGFVKAKSEQSYDDSNEDNVIDSSVEDVDKSPDSKETVQKPIVNTTDEIWVLIDNERVLFDQQPIIKQDRTLVPMRAIFEKLGAKVDWDDSTKTAIAEKNGIVIKIQIDNNIMKKGEEDIVLDVPAQLLNSRTLVPIRAISEAFGCKVDWLGEARTVTIVTSK